MSPTLLREKGYRFFFFSREETRMHVHIHSENGEAEFWLKPEIELAKIINVEEPNPGHFYWPDLDVDLEVESIEHPERFPLIFKGNSVSFNLGTA